jgi:putative 4-mercaptohistidine N1-methyltranferase
LLLLGNTWPSAEAQDNAFALLSAAGMEYVGLEEDLEFTIRDTIRQTTIGLQHLSLWRKSTSIVANVAEAQGKDGMMKVAGKLGQNMYSEYANPKVVEQYAAFHFTPGDAESYPLRCAQRCIEVVNQLGVHQGRAIEFGAGPGRAAMELAKHFESVVGSDFSQHLIDIGKVLLTEGKLRFSSGSSEIEVTPTDLQIGSVEQSRLELLLVDACAPTAPGDEASCDLVCCFNLIDRLPDPKAFLVEAARRLRPGGLLVISSPYTWLEAFTPKDKWIGGRKNGGKNIRSIDALREYLTTGDSAQFEDALAPEDIFFRFEETPRLRQETKAEMSFWRKKH